MFDFQLFLHLAFIVKVDTPKIRIMFEYEFRRRRNAAETTRYVNVVCVFGFNALVVKTSTFRTNYEEDPPLRYKTTKNLFFLV